MEVKLNQDKLIFITLFFVFSCNKNIETVSHEYIQDYRNKYFQNYKYIYDICIDTLNKWKFDSISNSKELLIFPYQLDSIFIFNKDSTRLFTTLNSSSSTHKDAIADNIREFGGAKIGGKWYFFFGASLVVPREFYQDSIYSALSFEELSTVAHNNYHHAALVQNPDGSFKAKEEFFEKYLSPLPNGSWEDKPRNVVDSMIIAHVIADRQKKLDPVEIAEIKARMAASKRPKEPHYIKLTLQKWGDNIANLFKYDNEK